MRLCGIINFKIIQTKIDFFKNLEKNVHSFGELVFFLDIVEPANFIIFYFSVRFACLASSVK